jgi:hypothetical protein
MLEPLAFPLRTIAAVIDWIDVDWIEWTTLKWGPGLSSVGRRLSVEHRGIAFSVVEMSFPGGWKWTVGKGRTVSVGVCATRRDAIRQAQTFIDAVVDWAA